MKGFERHDLSFSLCGLHCILCPMKRDGYCPGCGGGAGNQSCAIARCSLAHSKVAYCWDCGNYPCERYRDLSPYESFLPSRNRMADIARAQKLGMERYHAELARKETALCYFLDACNDGRHKSFYYTAVGLLPLETIEAVLRSVQALDAPQRAAQAIAMLSAEAANRGLVLKLQRKPKRGTKKSMMNDKGFDLWADDYDRSVGLSEESDTYPFAGYKRVLGEIYRRVHARGDGLRVLDIGFGTGTLTQRFYTDGYSVSGLDFSGRMIALAQPKMPRAELVCHDFTTGLPESWQERQFDCVVSTYALHHLTDDQKPDWLKRMRAHLAPGGILLIGDVAFETRAALEKCRTASGGEWDDSEYYFVADELRKALPFPISFAQLSHCAGVLAIEAE